MCFEFSTINQCWTIFDLESAFRQIPVIQSAFIDFIESVFQSYFGAYFHIAVVEGFHLKRFWENISLFVILK